jgi:hypothetical protein
MVWAFENLREFRILANGPFISSPVLDRLLAFSNSPVGEKLEISIVSEHSWAWRDVDKNT